MTVKIMIKRSITPEKAVQLTPLLKRLRTQATNMPGYISGETLKNYERPGEYLVISTWQTIEDWREWLQNPERKEVQAMIDALIGRETEYEIYIYR